MSRDISGVILAGGSNSRFDGLIKANLKIEGKTIISRIVDSIRDIFDEIIIVTNTPEEFKYLNDLIFVKDFYLKKGPMGGIHAALKISSKKAIFVFAGDMPLVNKELIESQIDYYHAGKSEVVVPCIGELIEPLHSIYSTSLFSRVEEYLNESTEKAVRSFFDRADVSYMQLEISDDIRNFFININSQSDIPLVENLLLNRSLK